MFYLDRLFGGSSGERVLGDEEWVKGREGIFGWLFSYEWYGRVGGGGLRFRVVLR